MENQPPPDEVPKIIGEGAYGCVIQPSIDINGNPDTVPGYISKIEIEKSTIDNEINVSNKIKQIPDYEDRFSPILENVPLELGKINVKEVNDCKIVESQTGDAKLEINKIKYVGKDTLESYLLNILEENPNKFIEILITTHIYLLDSLSELNTAGIIHNDIKENNILCRDETGIPILIDFGLSIETEYLKLPEPASILGSLTQEKGGSHIYKYFFKYEPSYEVWCIELHILNFMLTELNREWLTSPVTQEQINYLLSYGSELRSTPYVPETSLSRAPFLELLSKDEDRFSSYLNKSWSETILDLNSKGNNRLLELIYESYGYQWRTRKVTNLDSIINEYIEKNLMNLGMFTKEELEIYRANMLEYFSSYNDKNWSDLFNDLISSQKTWDNYALSIVYLKIIVSFGITHPLPIYPMEKSAEDPGNSPPANFLQNEKMKEYGELLKRIICSKPNERKSAEETKEAIKEVLHKVPKTVFRKIMDIIFGRKENHESIKQGVVTKKIDELNRESVLYESKRLF